MSTINDELIKILRRETPPKMHTVDVVMQILSMGKEAAYRRLRGEIPFTLEEAAIICNNFKVSMDTISGRPIDKVYDFKLDAMFSKDPMQEYYSMLHEMREGVKIISMDPNSHSYRAYRTLPAEFFYRYDSLSKVYIYIVLYQLYLGEVPSKLRDVYIQNKVFQMQRETAEAMQDINATMIIDKNIFSDFIGIVKYFIDMGLFVESEIKMIRQELLQMLDDLERCASTGYSLKGKQLDMYISSISFDATYSYIEGAGVKSCSTSLYCIDHLSCSNEKVTENHKLWIKSLIRFSTQISVSGELQRTVYFSNQRQAVEQML